MLYFLATIFLQSLFVYFFRIELWRLFWPFWVFFCWRLFFWLPLSANLTLTIYLTTKQLPITSRSVLFSNILQSPNVIARPFQQQHKEQIKVNAKVLTLNYSCMRGSLSLFSFGKPSNNFSKQLTNHSIKINGHFSDIKSFIKF
jgi:hypothetical protein